MVFSIPKMHKYASFMAYSAFVILSQHFIKDVDAHGFMSTPRTRNQFAAEEGLDGGSTAGLPDKEFCSHCLNSNNKVCGKSTNFDYDDYKDSSGNPMPWISQENYVEGQVVTVKSYLDTHHNGHMELRACSLGSLSTQECFDTAGHELIFQEDVPYGMPADPSYPERGYYAGGQGGGLKDFEMRFKLPDGIYGDEIMIQYKYITANSCSPPGYNEYFNGANSKNEVIDSSYWTSGLDLCTPPYPNDGTRGMTWPEQFFNCAEVSIGESSPTPPTPPTTPSPTKQPIPSPVQSPTVTGSGCCSWSPYLECTQLQNTWCQESVDRCEGPCSGIWLTSDPPAPSPVKDTDATGSGCCSWYPYLECTQLSDTWCQENVDRCENGCAGKWLTSDAPAPSPVVTPSSIPTATEQPVAAPIVAPIQPPTISSPTVSPVSTTDILSCSSGSTKSSWDALSDMDVITYTVSNAPFTLSVLSSGGAAGDGSSVVSEGQAYGVLSAALTLASMEEKDKNYAEAKNKFYGYFNGWKKMCKNSEFAASCQEPFYCNGGQWPCLPGWKQDAALTKVEGNGAAPDGDEDAILGMIIAVKAVGNDSNIPFWLEEVRIWADESCTQFLQDNTVLSDTGSHRILGLGSCWGGWEDDGNNPSYHAPGHYRVMRDFQQSFVGRTYTLPSLGDDGSLTDAWNMLIDTSYKFLETTQCPGTGLVPNWALVAETNASELEKYPGEFSASGTPQFEFGSEAGRTMWRIAVDAIMYPSESASQAGPFLSPLHIKMVENFDPNPSNSDSYFGDGTVSTMYDHVSL